jgi:hypothetical protein
MAVIAGIDEAGYGPRLGPLVVSGVAFEVPDAAIGDDLWTRLANVVGRSPRDRDRIPVDDSKALFDQSRGVRHIERTALAFAAAAGRPVASFRSLLSSLAELNESVDAYPWHDGADFPLPLAADAAQVERDAERLRSAEGARFLGVRSIPVLVGEFNRLVESVGTKSATLFLKTARLLSQWWQDWGERGVTAYVDKHGGRNRYGLLLYQTFFGARIQTLAEGSEESIYEVTDGQRRMTVGFYVRGDSRHMPVALASIFSKYVRELFMHTFNAYWRRQVPGLRPTAGYATDAARFLRDIAAARQQLGIADRMLVRVV